jgi:hypothetical protein
MSAMPLKNGITKNVRSRQATSKMLAVKTSLLMKELESLPKPPPREFIQGSTMQIVNKDERKCNLDNIS